MKNLSILLLFILGTTMKLFAQGEYDLQLVIGQDTDCTNDIFYVDIQIKSTTSADTFRLYNQNYRFTFDTLVLANPRLEAELSNSGLEVYADGSYSVYSAHTLYVLGDVASYSYTFNGGVGYLMTDEWLSIGRVAFDIIDDSGCINLNWNDQTQFPFTYIGAINSDGTTYEVAANSYTGFSACVSSLCANCPANLSFSNAIPDGLHLADQSISAAGTVTSFTNISFKAGQIIELVPGFSVELSAVFSVEIEGCSGGTN